jgi:hypothetical protein
MASSLTTDRRFAISIPRTNSLQSFFFFPFRVALLQFSL